MAGGSDYDVDVRRAVAGGSDYDVVVIGAGQAGLALAYYLQRQNLRFVALEAGHGVGTAWRERWDSLTLFTPRRYDALPRLDFPGDPDGYPGRDEVVAYLERYAERFRLPVKLNSEVRSVSADGGRFSVEVEGHELTADNVVVTTGPFQHPRLPAFAADLAPEVFQTHSTAYRPRPSRVRHRRGVTDVPGLYFLGLSWQYTRGSALIGWVKNDAKFIAEQIAARTREPEPALAAEGV